MKNIVIALAALLLVLVGVMGYNVWRAETAPVVKTPSIVEQGRMNLHNQLVQAEQREAQIEKVYWNSPAQLQILIKSHQQRISELNGNDAGGEIVAHDKDAVARLEKRISDIEAQREAEAAAQAERAKEAAEAAKQAQQQGQTNQPQ